MCFIVFYFSFPLCVAFLNVTSFASNIYWNLLAYPTKLLVVSCLSLASCTHRPSLHRFKSNHHSVRWQGAGSSQKNKHKKYCSLHRARTAEDFRSFFYRVIWNHRFQVPCAILLDTCVFIRNFKIFLRGNDKKITYETHTPINKHTYHTCNTPKPS